VARNAGNFLYAPTLSLPEGSKIPKGRGECSMVGKGARQRNRLAGSRQHKVCMAKAKLPESQSSRCNGPRHRRVVETMYWVRHGEPPECIMYQPAQRAPYRGMKGTNGTPKHTASLSYRNCGIAYTGCMMKSWTCRATEPPYYSRWTRNGVCSQPLRLDRHGYKGMGNYPRKPRCLGGREAASMSWTPNARAS
jgi:hypothetical protein